MLSHLLEKVHRYASASSWKDATFLGDIGLQGAKSIPLFIGTVAEHFAPKSHKYQAISGCDHNLRDKTNCWTPLPLQHFILIDDYCILYCGIQHDTICFWVSIDIFQLWDFKSDWLEFRDAGAYHCHFIEFPKAWMCLKKRHQVYTYFHYSSSNTSSDSEQLCICVGCASSPFNFTGPSSRIGSGTSLPEAVVP